MSRTTPLDSVPDAPEADYERPEAPIDDPSPLADWDRQDWGLRNKTEPTTARRVVYESPLIDASDFNECVAWSVALKDPESGGGQRLGSCAKDTTEAEFFRTFIDVMPKPGGPAVTFFFYPLDEAGAITGPYKHKTAPYKVLPIHSYNRVLAQVRKEVEAERKDAEREGGGGVNNTMIALLQQQLATMQAQIEAANARERAALEARLSSRESERNLLGAQLSQEFGEVNKMGREQFGSVIEFTRTSAAQLAAQQLALATEQREQAKLDASIKIAEIQAAATARAEEAKAQVERARLELDAKIAAERLRFDQEKEERRLEREEAKELAREREAERLRAHEEREKARDREAVMLRDAAKAEAERNREHTLAMLNVISNREAAKAEATRPMGALQDILGEFGLTLPAAAAMAATFVKSKLDDLSGGGSVGEAIVKELGKTARAFAPTGDEEDDEEEEEEEAEEPEADEPEPEPEPEEKPRRRARRGTPTNKTLADVVAALPPAEPVPGAPPALPAPTLSVEELSTARNKKQEIAAFIDLGMDTGNWHAAFAQAGAPVQQAFREHGPSIFEGYGLSDTQRQTVEGLLKPREV